jgi:hypothetical protein
MIAAISATSQNSNTGNQKPPSPRLRAEKGPLCRFIYQRSAMQLLTAHRNERVTVYRRSAGTVSRNPADRARGLALA